MKIQFASASGDPEKYKLQVLLTSLVDLLIAKQVITNKELSELIVEVEKVAQQDIKTRKQNMIDKGPQLRLALERKIKEL